MNHALEMTVIGACDAVSDSDFKVISITFTLVPRYRAEALVRLRIYLFIGPYKCILIYFNRFISDYLRINI